MNLRTPRGIRFAASSLTFIASKLAPTEDHIRLTEQHCSLCRMLRQPLSSIAKSLTLNVKQPACT
ncbi:hypothetical protein C8K63_108301 [Pseudomonas sp. GV085]|nr:hypothetical protein C8K63_108301 [Pseudomonas sp. GV085]